MLSWGGFKKWVETDSHKELYKLLFFVPISLIGSMVMWAIRSLLSKDQPTTPKEWFDFIIGLPISAFTSALESPIWFAITISLFLVLSAFYYVALRFVQKIQNQENLLATASTFRALVEQAGMQSHWPNAIVGDAGAPWDQLISDILRVENRNLLILGANGIDTFGSERSPLHDAIIQFRGNMRIILSDPNSRETLARANSVGTNIKAYKKSIRLSVEFIGRLRLQSRIVALRYYSGKPNWKLLMTDQRVWVQYYMPGGPNVAETPVYIFEKTSSPYNLYELFSLEFERIWERCATNKVIE